MADPKKALDRIASGYAAAKARAAEESGNCPTCGKPIDDVPNPDPEAAKEFEKGATEGSLPLSQMVKNIKEGLGLGE